MNAKTLAMAGIIVTVLSFAAIQAFASSHYYELSQTSMTGNMNRHMNGNSCNMMNGVGMTRNHMNGPSMNYQECQRHMDHDGSQTMNSQYHQQKCQQNIGPGRDMSWEQCQAMYQYCHT